MKPLIIGINLGDSGSTGNMMIHSLEYASKHGPFDYLVITPKETIRAPCAPFGEKKVGFFEKSICHFFIRWGWLSDGDYYLSRSRTIVHTIKKEIKTGRKIIVHLHNLHHVSLHVHYVLNFLCKQDIPVLYTLHDCWSFTGGCYHYEEARCDGFMRGCKHCPVGFRRAHSRLKRKTTCLIKAKNFTLMPCSKWLSSELEKSVLAKIPRIVVNGETSLCPAPCDISYRKSLGLEASDVVLVSVNKGIRHLRALAAILPANYRLYVVGGKKEEAIGNMVLMGHLVHEEYAKLLAVADCFVSTTPEDTLPLALMEAQLSGLPVVGFGHGGTPELITEKTGIMVGKDDDVGKLLAAIVYVINQKPFKREDILDNGKRYGLYEYAKRMLPIYMSLI